MKNCIDVTISIVNYNGRKIIKDCIESILKNTEMLNYEIIVIDNASSDGSPEMMKKDFPMINLIVNKRNEGFAKANNKVFKYASGKYFLLLNPDCIVTDNTIAKMLKLMEERKDVGIIGCKIINTNGEIEISSDKFPTLYNELVLKIKKNVIRHNKSFEKIYNSTYMKSQEVDWVSGAVLLIRSEIYRKINGMDEEYFLYFEDIDLCKRVKNNGWKIFYETKFEVMHMRGSSVRKKSKEDISSIYHKSHLYYYKRHNPFQYHLLRLYLNSKGFN
jgi:hypothetical protein